MEPEETRRTEMENAGEDEGQLSPGAFVFEMVKVFFLAAAIIIPVRIFLFQPFFVQGTSMEPNFEDGEYLIVNELGYKRTDVPGGDDPMFSVEPWREFSRQQPIVFRSPVRPDQFLIKRVIGLPGETVEIRSSRVYIRNAEHPDGFVLDESAYLAPSVFTSDSKPVTLTESEYFVLGDNRTASYDSRSFGPVHKDIIIGDVLIRAWPITRAEAY